MQVILNIGLKQSDNFVYNPALTELFIKAHTVNELGFFADFVSVNKKTVIHEQGSEETLIFVFDAHSRTEFVNSIKPLIKGLATKFNQDCIAYALINGGLAGEYAENWGDFNLNYFHFNA